MVSSSNRFTGSSIGRALAAAIVVSCSLANTLAQCTIEPGKATVAADWDATFTQNGPGRGLEPKGSPGWTGGDSTYSLLLPNGDTAFFFSDSYIGESPVVKGDGTVTLNSDGVRVTGINCRPPMCSPPASIFAARNSIVIRSRDSKQLRTLVGPKNAGGLSTSFFPEPTDNLYYWLGEPILLEKNKIAVVLLKHDAKLAYHGSAIAKVDGATLSLEGITQISLPDHRIHWGVSFVKGDDGFLYIYGKGTADGRKLPYVARTRSLATPEAVADSSKWTAWNGTEWVADLTSATSLVEKGRSISDEFSVARFTVNGRPTLIMSALDSSVPFDEWRDLTLYSACRPEGPFLGEHRVYRMPEGGARTINGPEGKVPLTGNLVVYNPHIHSQFARDGKILVSYNSNRRHNSDSIFIDGYRPRFIWVPIKGLMAGR